MAVRPDADVGVLAIRLLGGLGNQLFQAAAGLHHADNLSVVLVTGWGGVSSRPQLECDLQGLEFSERLALSSLEDLQLSRPMHSAVEAITVAGLRYPRSRTARGIYRAIRGLSPHIFHLHEDRGVHLVGGIGTGYTSVSASSGGDVLLSGYFQSAAYVGALKAAGTGSQLVPRLDTEWFCRMEALAARERPLVVHVRLNDYVDSPLFGAVRSDYYSRALVSVQEAVDYGRIWIFSDEPSLVWDFLPQALRRANPRLVSDEAGSIHSSSMMAAMSLGVGYVLTNSTFGYWAAMMSPNPAPVAVPKPWFANGQGVPGLIPEEWLQIERESTEW